MEKLLEALLKGDLNTVLAALALILVGPAVTAAAFTFVSNTFRDRRDQRVRQLQVRRAVFAEIRKNVADLLEKGYAPSVIAAQKKVVMEDRKRKVLISYRKYEDFVFRELKTEVSILPPDALWVVMDFYSEVDSLHSIIDDINSTAYGKISPEGRGVVMDDLGDAAKKVRNAGFRAMRVLRRHLSVRNGERQKAAKQLRRLYATIRGTLEKERELAAGAAQSAAPGESVK